MAPLSVDVLNKDLPITFGRVADFAEDAVSCMRRLRVAHGDVAALQEGTQRIHFVFGPTYTKQVLSDSVRFHSHFFAVRGPKKSAQRRVTSGLLTMNGDEHKQHRRMVMGPFQKRAISAYHDTVVQMGQNFLKSWHPGETKDLAAEMTQYMLQLTSSVLFGFDVPELAFRIGELTERWVALNHQVGPAALSSESRNQDDYEQLLASAEELEQAVQEMIAIRRGGKMGFDVLSLLMRAHEAEEGVTDEQLIGHIVLLFSAAHLTSAHTLAWTLFLLSQHSSVMKRLYEEFQDVLQGAPPRPEDLDQLTYLDRVLKESMRVLPASAYSQRIAAAPVELGPFSLQRGDIVLFSQFMTHHIPELFDRPDEFLPDRWETISPSPYAYLPFGAGPRMCVGAALGGMQLKISLPILLNHLKMTLAPNARVDARVMSTMLFPCSSIPVLLEPHNGRFSANPASGSIHQLVDLPVKTNQSVWAA